MGIVLGEALEPHVLRATAFRQAPFDFECQYITIGSNPKVEQKAAVQMLTGTNRIRHVTTILQELDGLPGAFQFQYKVLLVIMDWD